jgi:hypothetical protein
MTTGAPDIVDVITMQLIGPDESVMPVLAELSYRVCDPYTVRAVFTGSHTMSTWLLGRELIAQGLEADQDSCAGTGDVQVWRDEDRSYVLISLNGVEGNALLAAPAEPLERFITKTEALVPFDNESDQMDPEISALIAALLTA